MRSVVSPTGSNRERSGEFSDYVFPVKALRPRRAFSAGSVLRSPHTPIPMTGPWRTSEPSIWMPWRRRERLYLAASSAMPKERRTSATWWRSWTEGRTSRHACQAFVRGISK